MARRGELERNVEGRVTRWAREQGIRHRKLNGAGDRAWPDRMFVLGNGVVAFVEFKRVGEQPTRLQEKTLADLTAAKHHARWFDDSEEAIAWLEALRGLRRVFGAEAAKAKRRRLP